MMLFERPLEREQQSNRVVTWRRCKFDRRIDASHIISETKSNRSKCLSTTCAPNNTYRWLGDGFSKHSGVRTRGTQGTCNEHRFTSYGSHEVEKSLIFFFKVETRCCVRWKLVITNGQNVERRKRKVASAQGKRWTESKMQGFCKGKEWSRNRKWYIAIFLIYSKTTEKTSEKRAEEVTTKKATKPAEPKCHFVELLKNGEGKLRTSLWQCWEHQGEGQPQPRAGWWRWAKGYREGRWKSW